MSERNVDKKYLKHFTKDQFYRIIAIKRGRIINKSNSGIFSPAKKARDLIKSGKIPKTCEYFKIMIEGGHDIYLASPIYRHEDTGKSKVFKKNKETLKIMECFNKIMNR